MQPGSIRNHNITSVDWALLVVRLAAAIIFSAHGAQKLFGAFGGPGLDAIVGMLGPIGYLVSIGEFFGGLGLAFGFLSRFSAASLIVIMMGAIVKVHAQHGFFLGEKLGFEFNLALIGLLAAVLIAGPGRVAIGRLLPLPKAKNSDQLIPLLQ
jgi:putative oxidoreductase